MWRILCFPQWVHHFTFPPAKHKILHILANTFLLLLLLWPPTGGKVVSHYNFVLHFPNDIDWWPFAKYFP